jgi:hypothetical protein
MVGIFDNSRRIVIEKTGGNVWTRSRQRFTHEEDAELLRIVEMNPNGSWEDVAKHFPNRTARQVRERYCHYLCPELNLSPWTPEDECLLRAKFEEYGPQWSILKMFFPNRSAVNIKNHWTTMISRQNRNMWETHTIIPSESISPRVFIPSVEDPSQYLSHSTTMLSQSSSPANSSIHVITGTNQSVEQEQKHEHEHPIDIFDLNLLQNSQFPMSDMFTESYLSYS